MLKLAIFATLLVSKLISRKICVAEKWKRKKSFPSVFKIYVTILKNLDGKVLAVHGVEVVIFASSFFTKSSVKLTDS